MAREEEEDSRAPARKPAAPVHEVGQSLDDLSLKELDARIAALHSEIKRLEDARKAKALSQAAADAFFKRRT
jgi:uncharacterized small protein (DUF1192 family)